MHIVLEPMSDLTEPAREMIRHHSHGPIAWGAWSWTFHTSGCWVAIAYDKECKMMGWSALTTQMDYLPVIGVFVLDEHRGTGMAKILISSLLNWLTPAMLPKNSLINANTEWWPAWPRMIESCGHRCQLWD